MKALALLLCLVAPAFGRIGEKLQEFKTRIAVPTSFEKTYKNGLTITVFETRVAKVTVYSMGSVIAREQFERVDEDFANGIIGKQPGKWEKAGGESRVEWKGDIEGLTARFSEEKLTVTNGKAEPLLEEVRKEENQRKLERF
jgi:hypothetical protein